MLMDICLLQHWHYEIPVPVQCAHAWVSLGHRFPNMGLVPPGVCAGLFRGT